MREVLEELGGLFDLHVEHVGDRAVAVADFERLAIEPLSFAHRARDVEVGQEVHLDPPLPLALALLASPALDVETEPAGLVAALLGVAGVGEHLANLVEHAGVRGRIAPRRASDGRLVDLHHLVDLARAAEARVRAGLRGDAAQPANQRPGKRLVQQRTLARSAHAGHADHRRERELNGDVLQVVGRDAFDRDRPGLRHAAAVLGHGNPLDAGQIAAGERVGVGGDLLGRALGHDATAVPARAGAKIDEPIGAAHDRLVMFDDDDGVAARLQFAERVDQPLVVAGMQSDRRLVEHVAHADQSRAEPGGQPHALQLAAAEACRPADRA